MTVQIKRFIELSDILALRFTCKNCGVTLSFPIEDNKLKRDNLNNQFLDVCPGCRHAWADLAGSTYEPVIVRAAVALNRLREVLYGDPPTPLGFSLSLEITPELAGNQQK
jgi:hypothetical protein